MSVFDKVQTTATAYRKISTLSRTILT